MYMHIKEVISYFSLKISYITLRCYVMLWYGMVWYGMVWYGMAWHGMAWCVMLYWIGLTREKWY